MNFTSFTVAIKHLIYNFTVVYDYIHIRHLWSLSLKCTVRLLGNSLKESWIQVD